MEQLAACLESQFSAKEIDKKEKNPHQGRQHLHPATKITY